MGPPMSSHLYIELGAEAEMARGRRGPSGVPSMVWLSAKAEALAYLKQKQIPFGNDYQKSKNNSKCNRRSFG